MSEIALPRATPKVAPNLYAQSSALYRLWLTFPSDITSLKITKAFFSIRLFGIHEVKQNHEPDKVSISDVANLYLKNALEQTEYGSYMRSKNLVENIILPRTL